MSVACEDPADPDAGTPDSGTPDSGPVDLGRPDAGEGMDLGPSDSGPPDQGADDAGPGAPVFEEEPADQTVRVGEEAVFTARARGEPPPALRWEESLDGLNFQALSTATATIYRTNETTLEYDGRLFRVVAENRRGTITSRAARLSIFAPGLVSVPQPIEAIVGSTVSFSVVAQGRPAPVLRWQRAEASDPNTFVDLPGATGPSYTTPPLSLQDDGARFRVAWSNRSLDGSLSAAGETPPAELTVRDALTASQILAGQRWSLVVRPDRTVAGFGEYISPTGSFAEDSNVARRPVQMYPGVLTDVVAITGHGTEWWALRADGSVHHWGRAGYGSDGRGNDGNGSGGPPTGQLFRTNDPPVPVLERVLVGGNEVPVPISGVCQIASGDRLLLMVRAVDASGAPTSCAPGAIKTLWFTGILTVDPFSPPTAVTATRVPRGELPDELDPAYAPIAAVYDWRNGSSGTTLFLLVLEDGRSFGLGANGASFGEAFALPGAPAFAVSGGGPVEVTAIWDTLANPVRSASIGWFSAFVVRQDGTVLSHGYAHSGVLGNGTASTPNVGPTLVRAETCSQLPCTEVLTGVTAISADFSGRVLAVKDGAIFGWGVAQSGVLGPVTGVQPVPIRVSPDAGFTAVAIGEGHALALRRDGAVFAWGDSSRGQNADPAQQTLSAPAMVVLP